MLLPICITWVITNQEATMHTTFMILTMLVHTTMFITLMKMIQVNLIRTMDKINTDMKSDIMDLEMRVTTSTMTCTIHGRLGTLI